MQVLCGLHNYILEQDGEEALNDFGIDLSEDGMGDDSENMFESDFSDSEPSDDDESTTSSAQSVDPILATNERIFQKYFSGQ